MLNETLSLRVKQYENVGLLRKRYSIAARSDNNIVIQNKSLINFCNNDYLGISTHPNVKNALIKGAEKYGLGSSASPIVSGLYDPHRILEEKFAAFLKRERAILFNSGYHANLGVLTTLANRKDTIISDKLIHASLLDAIQLSRAKHMRFRHYDFHHCEELLRQSLSSNIFLVSESVFSMEGIITPIKTLATLAKKHHAALIVDDAHGFGILGEKGRGITEQDHLNEDDLPYLITPFGKALGGTGAMVSGKSDFIEALIQFARSYHYSTAMPPALALAMIESLTLLENETWRIEELRGLIQYFIRAAKERNLPLVSEDLTPIKSILIGDSYKTLKIKNYLLEQNLFVSCIRPPSVPQKQDCIRISLNCLHKKTEIDQLLNLMADAYEA